MARGRLGALGAAIAVVLLALGITASSAGAFVVVDPVTHQRFGVMPAAIPHSRTPSASLARAMARLRAASAAPSSSSCTAPCLLTWHGGAVQHSAQTDYLIWWVPPEFETQGAEPYRQGVSTFVSDLALADGSSTNPLSVATQYSDGTAHVPYAVQNGGLFDDTDNYPGLPPGSCTDTNGLGTAMVYCLTDAEIQTELSAYILAHGLPANIDTEYFVLLPPTVGSCLDPQASETPARCSYTGYCGYHGAATTVSGQITYAVIPWDYNVPGCDINLENWSPEPGYPNTDFIDAGVSVVSHELSETQTDPLGTAWYDGNGEEIGDKCAYNYGSTQGPDSVLGLISNSTGYWNFRFGSDVYLLQFEWSNLSASCVASLAQSANTSVPTVSGTAIQGQTLTESHGGWNPTPAGYSYQWEDCDRSGNNCAAISSATNQTYTLATSDVGHTVRVQELAVGNGVPASSAPTSVVLPLPPQSTGLPGLSGTTTQGQTLTESHGPWLNSPTTYSYQWQDCDPSGANCSAISGATGQTYTLSGADAGHTIRVQETAANAGGSGAPATSSATGTVTPLPPSTTDGPAVSGDAIEGRTLTELHASWANAPTAYGYQWQRCNSAGGACVSIVGETRQAYSVRTADIGHRLRVLEAAANAGGVGPVVGSAPTSVVGPSLAHVVRALNQILTPHGAHIARVLTRTGYRASFSAPSAGRLTIVWSAGRVVVARAASTFAGPVAGKVVLKLTPAGKRLVRRSARVNLLSTASFTPTGVTAISVRKSFTLSR